MKVTASPASASLARTEAHIVLALELQDPAGIVRCGDFQSQLLDDATDLRHLVGIALGELALADPQRILQPYAHVAAHDHGLGSDVHLVAPAA
jgi:hypothetical protein